MLLMNAFLPPSFHIFLQYCYSFSPRLTGSGSHISVPICQIWFAWLILSSGCPAVFFVHFGVLHREASSCSPAGLVLFLFIHSCPVLTKPGQRCVYSMCASALWCSGVFQHFRWEPQKGFSAKMCQLHKWVSCFIRKYCRRLIMCRDDIS